MSTILEVLAGGRDPFFEELDTAEMPMTGGQPPVDWQANGWAVLYENPLQWPDETTSNFDVIDVLDQIRAREAAESSILDVPDFIPAEPPKPPEPPIELQPERFSLSAEEMPVMRDGTVLIKRELLQRLFGEAAITKLVIHETDEADPTRNSRQLRLFENEANATFARDFTITEIIAAVAQRYQLSDGRLPRISYMRKAISLNPWRELLNDPRFNEYLNFYNRNPRNFVDHVQSRRHHRAYNERVLNSPARLLYLENYQGTSKLLEQIYKDGQDGQSD